MIVTSGAIKHKTRNEPNRYTPNQVDTLYNSAGAPQSTISRPAFLLSSGNSDIVYTTQKRAQRGRSNTCHHSQVSFRYGSDGTTFGTLGVKPPNTPLNGYYKTVVHHQQCCLAQSAAVSAAIAALGRQPGAAWLGSNAQAYINSAWDKLRPDLTRFSLPNDLLEMGQVTDLFKVWKENVSLVKNLAGIHLNYKFGWAPTIGDLSALTDLLVTFMDKIKAFEALVGKVVQSSTNSFSERLSASGSFGFYSGAPNDLVTWNASWTNNCRAFVAYAPMQIAVLNNVDKIIRVLMDAVGFELNPRIIWEAIPFSFVLDWFFGFGSFLDRLKIDALELPISMVDSFVQSNQELKVEWSWDRGSDPSLTNSVTSAGAVHDWKYFHRMPIFPDYASLAGLGWKLPSFNQATLLMSLGTTFHKSF